MTKRKASLVLQIIDDFKNLPVRRDLVKVRLADGRRPLARADGYFIFMDLLPGIYTISISGYVYQPVQMAVVLDGGPCPVIPVRVMPGRAYPLPRGGIRLMGNTVPGSEVQFVYSCTSRPLKLLYDYEGGTMIRLFTPTTKLLDGRELCIDQKEFFKIIQTVDGDAKIYRMDRVLSDTYKKGAAHLSYVTRVKADARGWFFMALPNHGGLEGFIEIPQKAGSRRELMLDDGEDVEVDL